MNNRETGKLEDEADFGEHPDLETNPTGERKEGLSPEEQSFNAEAKVLNGSVGVLETELPVLAQKLEKMTPEQRQVASERVESASKAVLDFIQKHEAEIVTFVALAGIGATLGGTVGYAKEMRNEFDGANFSYLNVLIHAAIGGGLVAGFLAWLKNGIRLENKDQGR